MLVHLHNLQSASSSDFRKASGASRDFTMLLLRGRDSEEVAIFMKAEQGEMSQSIADIFNGNVEGLAERIEDAMDQVNDMDVSFSDFALAIACDLTGADLTEAYAARKAAKVAAE